MRPWTLESAVATMEVPHLRDLSKTTLAVSGVAEAPFQAAVSEVAEAPFRAENVSRRRLRKKDSRLFAKHGTEV